MPLLCLREAFKANCLSKCINLFPLAFIHPGKELTEHEYSFLHTHIITNFNSWELPGTTTVLYFKLYKLHKYNYGLSTLLKGTLTSDIEGEESLLFSFHSLNNLTPFYSCSTTTQSHGPCKHSKNKLVFVHFCFSNKRAKKCLIIKMKLWTESRTEAALLLTLNLHKFSFCSIVSWIKSTRIRWNERRIKFGS